ncbi:MAG: T9SS type A sorting domain-containing protein [Bacteroidetes bacterium]|nr:T9SS type A sorting domain-containing protein [Bacteroidota bacterium]
MKKNLNPNYPFATIFIITLFVLMNNHTAFAQLNTWVKITNNQIGNWGYPAFTYSSGTKEYVLTLGTQTESGVNSVYSVQSFKPGFGRWINALPHDSLYGVWADSIGYTKGNGQIGKSVFGTNYWALKNIEGYLRPNLGASLTTRSYSQFCYNTTDGKIYFYINNSTFTYDPAKRIWDTISVNTHPNTGNAARFLKNASLCYDRYNKEIVLFGGVGPDKLNGSPGTWTFNPATKSWKKLNLAVEPPPRINSPMVYDPDNKVIIMFGGDHCDQLTNETWVYNCVTRTWTKKNPPIRPTPRAGHALLYMPKSHKVVMVGGYNFTTGTIPEIWTYNANTNIWALVKRLGTTEIIPTYPLANPTMSGLCAVNSGDTLIALADSVKISNSIYAYHTYRMACNPTIIDASGTTIYGVSSDLVLTRGGSTEPSWYTNGVPAPDKTANENFLVSLPLNTWTKLSPPKIPDGDRAWGTTILDTDRDIIIKFSGGHSGYCGNDVTQYSIPNNRYTIGYRPEFYIEYNAFENPSPGPFSFGGRPFMPTHTVKAYAYDVKIRKIVYVQGTHTYLYDPDRTDWIKNIHIHGPSGGYGGGYNAGLCSTPKGVYGQFNNSSYLFSGDSLKWKQLPQTGILPLFYADQSGVVYDSKRDRIIAVKGKTSEIAQIYEYVFSSGKVTRLYPSDSTLATGSDLYRESVYIPDLDIILYQIQKPGGNLAYDCAKNKWISTGLMYDPKRKIIWHSGGRSEIHATRLGNIIITTEENSIDLRSLAVSPNPFNSVTTIHMPSSINYKNATLQVFDIQGKLVADLTSSLKDAQVQFKAENLDDGLYIVRLITEEKIYTAKINYLNY